MPGKASGMSYDDEVSLKLGREVIRMIGELKGAVQADVGYMRRTFTFRGGEVVMFLVNTDELADVFEKSADAHYAVSNMTPPSQVN